MDILRFVSRKNSCLDSCPLRTGSPGKVLLFNPFPPKKVLKKVLDLMGRTGAARESLLHGIRSRENSTPEKVGPYDVI